MCLLSYLLSVSLSFFHASLSCFQSPSLLVHHLLHKQPSSRFPPVLHETPLSIKPGSVEVAAWQNDTVPAGFYI